MKDYVKAIITSLKEDEWAINRHTISRKKDNVSLWTANGRSNLDFYPLGLQAFNMFDKYKVHKAVCDCIARGGKP